MSNSSKAPITDAVELLHRRCFHDKPERLAALEKARVNGDVAQAIYDLRVNAGLTQRDLAKLIGTQASVICRLEDADYVGHSLNMLTRIAAALGKHVQVKVVDRRYPEERRKVKVTRRETQVRPVEQPSVRAELPLAAAGGYTAYHLVFDQAAPLPPATMVAGMSGNCLREGIQLLDPGAYYLSNQYSLGHRNWVGEPVICLDEDSSWLYPANTLTQKEVFIPLQLPC